MKSSHVQRYPVLSNKLLAAVLAFSGSAGLLSPVAHAASGSWLGATDSLWSVESNWSAAPVPGAGEIATFNGAGNGNTVINLGAGVTIGSVVFDTSSAAAYTIGSGAVGSQTLTFGAVGGAITMNSTVGANQLFNSNLALATSTTANNAATYYTVTNNSTTNSLTLAGGISASTAGVKTLRVTGAGNTAISGAITSGSGNVSLFKTGTGTLTLSGGATWSGNGITDGANFSTSAVFREGTTILNGGSYSASGTELVIGGVATHGGAGTDATLQLDNGAALTNINWLSIGRGNGTGTATSNLVLNGNSSVTTERMSAGFNAGSALNLPKGTITLNGTSTLTATNTQLNVSNFAIGESAGSDVTLTVNDSAVVNKTGGSVDFGNQTQGAVQIGREGKGTVIMNGGTFNAASTDLGRGVNNATAQNGTLTIKTGAIYNNEGDFRMGFAGGASGRATLNLQGGTLNIGTTTKRKMVIGTWDSSQSTINVQNGGNLNLNQNTDIRFSQESNIGPNVINLEAGGAITSYSDNKTTANGSGVLDLMWKGQAGSNTTFNLNGGTLAIRQVVSTTNNGTRTFNFNGGTLKATGDVTGAGNLSFFHLGTGSARANVRNGGAIIDTNGFNVAVVQALQHSNIVDDLATDGGLTKNGLGTLTLTSNANDYNGLTKINAGTFALGATASIAASSGIEIATGAAFDTSAQSFTMLGGQTVTFGLDGSGVGSAGLFQAAALDIGSASVSFNITGGALDDAAYILASYTSISGTSFGAVSNLPSGYELDYNYLGANQIALVVSAIPEPSAFAAFAGLVGLGFAASRRRRRVAA